MPRSAASSSVPGEVTVTQSGGCGCCTGFGRIARSGTENEVPRHEKRSSVHMRGSARIVSSHVCLVVSGSISKPRELAPGRRARGAQLEAAARQDVEHRGALGDANRVIHLRHAHHGAVPDADSLRLHRARREEQLGRGAVRVLLEEVVLDGPDEVEAELVGEPHLVERVLVHLALDARPRTAAAPTARRRSRSAWAAS